MARDIIEVQYPVLEDTLSVAVGNIERSTVDADNGISIKDAFKNKNNTLFIYLENDAKSAATVSFVAGDVYPNSILGDLDVELAAESETVLQVQDIARFENKNGSINLDFSDSYTGSVFAVAKSVALNK